MSDDLRLRATVDDRASGPIRDIGRALRQVSQAGSIAPLSREFSGLHGVLSTVGRELRSVTVPALGAVGLAGGGAIASLIGVTKALGALADKTLDMRYMSKELNFATREIKAFGAAAEHFRIDPSQAMGGLRVFAKNIENLKANLPGVRDELYQHGGADIAAALKGARTNMEALDVIIGRMQALGRAGNAIGAKNLAQLMFGDESFARLNSEEIKKRLQLFSDQTKEQTESAEKYADSLNRIGSAFERLKNKIGGAVLPYIAAPAEGLADFLEQKKAPAAPELVQKQKRLEAIERQLSVELNPVQGNRLRDERERLTREIEALRDGMKKLREETEADARAKKMGYTAPSVGGLPIVRASLGGMPYAGAPSIVGPGGGRYAPPSGVSNPMGGLGGTAGVGAGRGSIGTGDDPRGLADYIRETAKKYGVDPDTAVAVAKSEGLRTFSGDRGTSFGAFQLHVGGGLGDEFRKQTGLDPSDPANERATIDWALKNVNRTGWGPYHGAKNTGIGPRAGLGGLPGIQSSAFVKELQSSVAGIRRQAIDPNLRAQLDYAAARAGLIAEITSGGQAGIGEGGPRIGSTRHDHGGAADLRLRDPATGRLLDMRVGDDLRRMSAFVRDSVAAGATGVGAGLGYMGPNTLHIGGGRPSVWGGADWIREAWRQGRENPADPSAIDRHIAGMGGGALNGSASIKVDVNAPKGTKVGVGYGGIFKQMELTRHPQMDPGVERTEPAM